MPPRLDAVFRYKHCLFVLCRHLGNASFGLLGGVHRRVDSWEEVDMDEQASDHGGAYDLYEHVQFVWLILRAVYYVPSTG